MIEPAVRRVPWLTCFARAIHSTHTHTSYKKPTCYKLTREELERKMVKVQKHRVEVDFSGWGVSGREGTRRRDHPLV